MDKIDLTFDDFTRNTLNILGKTEWVTVFDLNNNDVQTVKITYFSALIKNEKVESALDKYQWDLHFDGGRPGFVTHFEGESSVTEYYRFTEEGIEPLVYWRTFADKDDILEISEEFRLYFNLYEKDIDGKKVFLFINEDGDEEEVVIVKEMKVDVKLKFIKEYISVKKSQLAIFFELMILPIETLSEIGQDKVDSVIKGKDFIYSLCIRDLSLSKSKSQGWLLGKKIITGLKKIEPTLWTTKEDEKFEEFIVGVDEDGKNILASCNVDYSSGSYHFLTPVFFLREVLKKYYENSGRYSVDDGYLRRDGFWNLRIMNNHTEHVVVWLGDLKHLPQKEQAHWKSFNLTPGNRKISHTDFTRNIQGNFADPEHPELYFKYKFEKFQDAWHKKFGWYLFKPLSKEDEHHLKSLHVPTTKEQKEFDDQIASITKILIDSLNEKEIGRGLELKKDSRSIDKLDAYLKSKGVNSATLVQFLRKLQSLRSTGIAHRKGTKHEEDKKFFGIGEKDNAVVFEDIIIKCIRMLNSFESWF